MDLNQQVARTPVRKASNKGKKAQVKPTEIKRVINVYLKNSNNQFYQIDFTDYDQFISKEMAMKSKNKSRAQNFKTIATGITPKVRKAKLKEVPFQEPICPPKLALKSKIEEYNQDIMTLHDKKIKALKQSGIMVASDLDDSKPSIKKRTPTNGSLHSSHVMKPLTSLPPIQKTDYNAAWKKHQITRNVQEAWGHRKSTSPVSSGSKQFLKEEGTQQTLEFLPYDNPSTFRNLKSKKSKGERSPDSYHTGPQIRSHTGMEMYSPIPASTKGSFGGHFQLLGKKQLHHHTSISHTDLEGENKRLSPLAMDSSSKHEMKTLESSHSQYRRNVPSSTSYQQSFKVRKQSALTSTLHSKKSSLIMSSNNFNAYKPKLPKLLYPNSSHRQSTSLIQKKKDSQDGLAVPIYQKEKKSPRYHGIPVPKGEPYYLTFKEGEEKDYQIKLYLFKNFQFLVIDCVYGEYIWDRDKIEFGELQDLTGKGLDFQQEEKTKAQLQNFVDSCVNILNGKIVVRAPDQAPAQIQLNQKELEGVQRVEKILKEMKLKNDKSYKRLLRSVTIMQKKFKSRSIHEIGQLKKKKVSQLPVLIKGAVKLGNSFYRYSIASEQDADLSQEMEVNFYDLTNRRADTENKRVKIFDVLDLIQKLKEGESFSLNKIAAFFLLKLQKFAEYLEFRTVGELIENAFEIHSKDTN